MAGKYFLVCSLLENWENNYGKTAVFPGSYSRILGKYRTCGYGRIGVYRVKDIKGNNPTRIQHYIKIDVHITFNRDRIYIGRAQL